MTGLCKSPLCAALNVLLMMLLLAGAAVQAVQAQPDQPAYQIKASYIYNILKFVHFPADIGKELRICILGENRFGRAIDELNAVALPDYILRVTHLGPYFRNMSLSQCHVLYLVDSEQDDTPAILASINLARVLTIGEHRRFIPEGGLIELYERNDTIRLRIDPKRVNQTTFTLDAQLVQLGTQ